MTTPDKKGQKRDIHAPRGMRDILGDTYYRFQGLFEKAQEIAVYYGFSPIETPMLEQEELFFRGVGEDTDIVSKELYNVKTKGGDKLVMRPEGTAAVMRAYIEHGMSTEPQPVFLYYSGPFFRHDRPQRGRYREFRSFGLEILGTEKSIADVIVIRTVWDILEEAGLKNLTLDVNSIGDAECRPNYIKALTVYYKKHADKLCPHCKTRIKENPFRVLDCKEEACRKIREDAPETIGYLCSACRAHFKEVIEYLDMINIPYRMNGSLVRGIDYYTRTVFEISETPKEGEYPLSLAGGGRYDNLAKSLGSRKPIPGVGAGLGMDRIIEHPEAKIPNPRILKKPKVYFIQLGFDAKLKSLQVIEMLRKAHVPIAQSLSKDSLSAQLAVAEKMEIPYTIIYGQKEAMEGSVIVRHMGNRSQETVPLKKLPDYIKHLK